MHSYLHNVSGFYLRRDLAETTLAQLLRLGLRNKQLQIIAADSSPATALAQGHRHALLKNLLTCSIAGAAGGITFGVLLEVALLLGDTSPLGTWLLLSPAMLLGWGALGGALLGGALGAARLRKPAMAMPTAMCSWSRKLTARGKPPSPTK
ncbi:hypothetical protein AAFN46_02925 [Pseudomonas sp. CAU 1711]|uniref:hypothetical protein n=1 Tax=Pseudomonas sp. CAU 1711 TaxID=3140356 RepID=UPI0032605385